MQVNLPPARSGDVRPRSTASLRDSQAFPGIAVWMQTLKDEGLLNTEASTQLLGAPTAECGVSLQYLLKLSERASELLSPDANTAEVVQRVVLPCTTRARRGRFFDMVPPEHTGQPKLYVVHAWSMPFCDMVEQLVHTLAPGLLPKPEPVVTPSRSMGRSTGRSVATTTSTPSTATTPTAATSSAASPSPSSTEGASTAATEGAQDDGRVYVWLDALALDQRPGLHAQADVALVKEVLKACRGGVAAVVDEDLGIFTRTWCQYEMWACIHYRDVAKLKICRPAGETSLSWLLKYEATVRRLDANQTETTKPEDRTHLLSEMRSVVGMKRMQQALNEALVVAVRTDLRWGGSFRDLAIYCALLLRLGESARVQQVLHHIPEIADDFKDTEVIYKIFSGKDKGTQIDEATFTGVLTRTGFDPDEAKNIFRQIRMYDKDCIGLEEFNEWWNSNQRKEVRVRNYAAPPVLTSEALAHNMQQMEALLQRKGLSDMSQIFRSALQEQSSSASMLQSGSALPMFNMHSDWEKMANEVLSRLHCQDYRGAVFLLHTLLLWNRDCLDQHLEWIQPSEALPRMGMGSVLKVLSQYLQLLINLLQGRPSHASLSQCLRHFRDKLQSSEAKAGGAAARSRGMSSKDVERHVVVRSMIGLKYGDGEPIDNALIAEAELSLGKVLGSHKVSNRSIERQLDYLNTMVIDYLRGNRAGELEKKREERPKPVRFRKLDYDAPSQSVLLSLGPEAAAFHQQQEEEEARARAQWPDADGEEEEEGEEEGGGLPQLVPSVEPEVTLPPVPDRTVSTPLRKFLHTTSLAGSHFDALFSQGGRSAAVIKSARHRAPRSSYAGPALTSGVDPLATGRQERTSAAGAPPSTAHASAEGHAQSTGRLERLSATGRPLTTRSSVESLQATARSSAAASTPLARITQEVLLQATLRERSSYAGHPLATRSSMEPPQAAQRLERASYAGHTTTTVDGVGVRFQRSSYGGEPSPPNESILGSDTGRWHSTDRQAGSVSGGGASDEGSPPGAGTSGDAMFRPQRQPKPPALAPPSSAFNGRRTSSTGSGLASVLSSAAQLNMMRQASSPGHIVLPKI